MKARIRLLNHLTYWFLAAVFLIWFYTKLTKEYQHTILIASVVWVVSISVVYFFNGFLIPRFLMTRRYVRFGLFTFYTVVISVWVSLLIILLYYTMLLTKTDGQIFPINIDIAFLLSGQFLVIAAGVLLHAVRENVRMIRQQNELEKQQLEIQSKLKETEMRFLKSQFHPHFLFNTLNNLYSLSLRKSEQTPEMILKLSELLDYSLHHTEADWVSLDSEFNFIQNYCELAHMRFGGSVEILFDYEIQDPGFQIPPLVLLPFVENAIKHGIHPDYPECFVKIEAKQADNQFNFRVRNKTFTADHAVDHFVGIGLSNVRSRLELLIPGKFNLDMIEADGIYEIHLRIDG